MGREQILHSALHALPSALSTLRTPRPALRTALCTAVLLLGAAGAAFGMPQGADEPSQFLLFLGRFHPLLVHLPIGMLIVAFLLEMASYFKGFEHLRQATLFVLLLGTAAAVAAMTAGLLLALGGDYDEESLSLHRRLGIGVTVAAVLASALKVTARQKNLALLDRAYVVVLVGTVGLLTAAGHQGGTLTHGSDFLTEHMPDPMRSVAGLPPRPEARAVSVADPATASVYDAVVFPIFEARCLNCHNPRKKKGDLLLDTPDHLLRGGENGPVLVPGDTSRSELFRRITLPHGDEDRMPPEGKKPLREDEIELIGWWILSGASFDQPLAAAEKPPAIRTILDRITAGARKPEGVFALALPPADPAQLAALEARGISVRALAKDVSLLHAQFATRPDTVTDASVAALAPVAGQVTWLGLGRTGVTDAGLAALAGFKHLTRLHLEQTKITDAGLAKLGGLEHLEYLNLYGTAVTDEGLRHLVPLKALKTVYLWQTRVTPAGAARLRQQRPGLQVNLGFDDAAPDSSGARPDSTALVKAVAQTDLP